MYRKKRTIPLSQYLWGKAAASDNDVVAVAADAAARATEA